MAERYTAEELIELLDDDFDVSEGEESDFEEDGVFSYLPGASLGVTNHAEPEASRAEPEASRAEPEASPSEAESQVAVILNLPWKKTVSRTIYVSLFAVYNCTKLAFISGIVAVYSLAMFIASEQQLEAFCG